MNAKNTAAAIEEKDFKPRPQVEPNRWVMLMKVREPYLIGADDVCAIRFSG